jgi:hypothetical protein
VAHAAFKAVGAEQPSAWKVRFLRRSVRFQSGNWTYVDRGSGAANANVSRTCPKEGRGPRRVDHPSVAPGTEVDSLGAAEAEQSGNSQDEVRDGHAAKAESEQDCAADPERSIVLQRSREFPRDVRFHSFTQLLKLLRRLRLKCPYSIRHCLMAALSLPIAFKEERDLLFEGHSSGRAFDALVTVTRRPRWPPQQPKDRGRWAPGGDQSADEEHSPHDGRAGGASS